jgi:large subunit ribosomal protein L14
VQKCNVILKFTVADNSGVKKVTCIANSRSGRQNKVCLGDYVVVSIYRGRYRKNFSFKKLCSGLVLTLKRIIRRITGYFIRFGENRILLFLQSEATVGNRLRGIIAMESYYFKKTKLISSNRWVI